jgi:predicted esterase
MVAVEEGRRSKEFLEAEGYSPEYHEYDMGHEVTHPVLADLVLWFHGVTRPAGAEAKGSVT